MRNTGLYVYYFSVDYDYIDVDHILDFHTFDKKTHYKIKFGLIQKIVDWFIKRLSTSKF